MLTRTRCESHTHTDTLASLSCASHTLSLTSRSRLARLRARDLARSRRDLEWISCETWMLGWELLQPAQTVARVPASCAVTQSRPARTPPNAPRGRAGSHTLSVVVEEATA